LIAQNPEQRRRFIDIAEVVFFAVDVDSHSGTRGLVLSISARVDCSTATRT
jgi:hypothetical protein